MGKLQWEDASLESMLKKAESEEAVEDDDSVTSFVVQKDYSTGQCIQS